MTDNDFLRIQTSVAPDTRNAFLRYASPDERRIVRKLVRSIFSVPGRGVTVYDGEDTTGMLTSAKEVYDHLATTGTDWILVYEGLEKAGPVWAAKHLGTVMLIWGNGEDVISDYSDNATMEALIDPILDSL
jgi:hypothetical protein